MESLPALLSRRFTKGTRQKSLIYILQRDAESPYLLVSTFTFSNQNDADWDFQPGRARSSCDKQFSSYYWVTYFIIFFFTFGLFPLCRFSPCDTRLDSVQVVSRKLDSEAGGAQAGFSLFCSRGLRDKAADQTLDFPATLPPKGTSFSFRDQPEVEGAPPLQGDTRVTWTSA